MLVINGLPNLKEKVSTEVRSITHMTLCYGLGFLKFIIKVNSRPFENCPKTPIKSAKSGAIFTACSILYFFNNCLALSIVDAP